ncbi:MAG: hypothetical protein PGN09_07505 [Sphingomonas fennica]
MNSLRNFLIAGVGVALSWVAILWVDTCAGPIAMVAALVAFIIAAFCEYRLARAASGDMPPSRLNPAPPPEAGVANPEVVACP